MFNWWICLFLWPQKTFWRAPRRRLCRQQPTRIRVFIEQDSSQIADPFFVSLRELFPEQQESIVQELSSIGLLVSSNNNSSRTLLAIAQDFVTQPAQLSTMLQQDFGLSPLVAHQTRAAILHALRQQQSEKEVHSTQPNSRKDPTLVNGDISKLDPQETMELHTVAANRTTKSPLYKQVIVNEKAKQRKSKATSIEYGLPKGYALQFPQLDQELQDFLQFMTQPSTYSQEDPIRPATATVYLRHAKLFFGWYLQERKPQEMSIYTIFPSKEKESASIILDFILWLRTARNTSDSYEANILRGLTKLLKFRFCKDSQVDPEYGHKSFEDIPIIREVRKWHRDANKRQAVAPRSSNEHMKWLSWPEYLDVIQQVKSDLEHLLNKHCSGLSNITEPIDPKYRKVANAFQKYLVLAFFANIPDRQRTVRELELGRSFVKLEDCWCIKHAPDDYKTGKTYGERPPLQLSPSLTPAIDDFLERWRPCLQPTTNHLFAQPRTGNPLTQDSVYQIVARSCHQYTGKRTNPHLLRDMIVTHVRESNASEKQLEALALYMGHSVSVQRASYDRRTLTKKVAPAVELLQSVNSMVSDNSETNL